MKMTERFKGKVAIITGGSTGIGAAAARRFAARGSQVALVARTVSALEDTVGRIRDDGGSAHAYPTDVADVGACAAMLEKVATDLGGIDFLVNNAGMNFRGDVERHPAENLARIVDVNLRAPIVLTRLALPYMRKRGGGCVINVASIAGQVPLPGEAVYSATKFGLRAFTFAIREELEGSGIIVSAVSPGPVDTGFIMKEIDDVPDLVFANPMSTADEVAEQILLCAVDGAVERTIPVMTGYLARLGNALPSLRRAIVPFMEKQGRAAKARYRSRRPA
jgi:short-subunit dehydrogenase